MQEENRRLIDEALDFEPVKNTFRLAWEFIILNKNFTLMAMGAFVLLNFLGTLPVIGFILTVFAAAFGIVMQMHVGRTLYGTANIETYVDEIQKSSIKEALSNYLQTAFGIYLSWLVFMLLIIFSFSLLGITTGVFTEDMNENDIVNAFSDLGLPLVIFALLFSYLQPLVHSNIVLSNSGGEGFKAVFTIFTKDVWSSAMQKPYFFYVVKVALIILVLLVLVGVIFFALLHPLLGAFSAFFIFMSMYIFMVIMSVTSMMARRIVEE